MVEHSFTVNIRSILESFFGDDAEEVFERSLLLQYINLKTKAASRGSKARSSFANLYAVYVLMEDYVAGDYHNTGDYSKYQGAMFTTLLRRLRKLPFGAKLQNHALNHRMNQEFKKFFPTCEFTPILRDTNACRYWINSNLVVVKGKLKNFNMAEAIISIIDDYIKVKMESFNSFISTCSQMKDMIKASPEKIREFIVDQLSPNKDARLFEIVSFAILKYFYYGQFVYFGSSLKEIKKAQLKLFKTGRTNANDGGIDFVMQPLGRFFQVTETLDVKKYFLDIEKIERFPISFVIKSDERIEVLHSRLEQGARKRYSIESIVQSYMSCIEEIINIEKLRECFSVAVQQNYLPDILNEIVRQSKLEFNISEEGEIISDDEDERVED